MKKSNFTYLFLFMLFSFSIKSFAQETTATSWIYHFNNEPNWGCSSGHSHPNITVSYANGLMNLTPSSNGPAFFYPQFDLGTPIDLSNSSNQIFKIRMRITYAAPLDLKVELWTTCSQHVGSLKHRLTSDYSWNDYEVDLSSILNGKPEAANIQFVTLSFRDEGGDDFAWVGQGDIDEMSLGNVSLTTSLEDKTKDISVDIYPTITDKSITVNKTQEGELNYEIFNLFGQKIKSENLQGSVGAKSIDVQELPSNVYFIRFNANGEKKTFRFIKK